MAAVILAVEAGALDLRRHHAAVGHVAASGRFVERWILEALPEMHPGTEVWLFLRGAAPQAGGLLGHGLVLAEPCRASGEGAGGARWSITVAFDSLLPFGDQAGAAAVESAFPGGLPAGVDGRSLAALPPEAEPALRRLWRTQGPAAAEPGELPGGTISPDAVRHVQVNRFERDPDARRLCLAFHGTSCAACGFSFEAAYGAAGTDMVAVHHLVPADLLGNGYQLDPVADLIPLCRNCHALAHGEDPARTVAELRAMAAGPGHMAGHVLSLSELQAQADARRILGSGPG